MRQVFLEGRPLHIFPCHLDKRPCTRHGFKDAVSDLPSIISLWTRACGPRIGVATGAISGIDVIDVDPRNGGHEWLAANRDRLSITRTHRTPSGGLHLIYRHGATLRSGVIAKGVDLKTTGGYIIWWPAHDFEVDVLGPVAAFPAWLAVEMDTKAIKARRSGPLATASVRPFTDTPTPTSSVFLRSKYLIRKLECAPEGERHKMLYWAACRFGNMIGEGKIKPEVAGDLLIEGAKANGLWRDDANNCLATIQDGLRKGKEEWLEWEVSKRTERPRGKELGA